MKELRRSTDSVTVTMEGNTYKPQLWTHVSEGTTTRPELKDKHNLSNKINYMLQTNSSLKIAGEAGTSVLCIYLTITQYTARVLLDQLHWLENYTFQKKQTASPASVSKIKKENNIK